MPTQLNKQRWLYCLFGFVALTLTASLAAWYYQATTSWYSFRLRPFDSEMWKKSDPEMRGLMLPSLLEIGVDDWHQVIKIPSQLAEKTKTEIVEILGEPNWTTTSGGQYESFSFASEGIYNVGYLNDRDLFGLKGKFSLSIYYNDRDIICGIGVE